MAAAIRDGARPPVKRNIASLVGGIAVAIGCFVLWLLVASELAHETPGVAVILIGALVALAIGVWIRVADL